MVQHGLWSSRLWSSCNVHVLLPRAICLARRRAKPLEHVSSHRISKCCIPSFPHCSPSLKERTVCTGIWCCMALVAHHRILGMGNLPPRDNGTSLPSHGLPLCNVSSRGNRQTRHSTQCHHRCVDCHCNAVERRHCTGRDGARHLADVPQAIAIRGGPLRKRCSLFSHHCGVVCAAPCW